MEDTDTDLEEHRIQPPPARHVKQEVVVEESSDDDNEEEERQITYHEDCHVIENSLNKLVLSSLSLFV